MRTNLVLLIEGKENMGLGHISRMLNLAATVSCLYEEVYFITNKYAFEKISIFSPPTDFKYNYLSISCFSKTITFLKNISIDFSKSVFVIDDYFFPSSVELEINSLSGVSLAIDDYMSRSIESKFILNPTPSFPVSNYAEGKIVYSGFGYSLVNQIFINTHVKKIDKPLSAAVCFGAQDVSGLLGKVIEVIKDFKELQFEIVGAKNKVCAKNIKYKNRLSPKEMKSLFERNDFFIGSASTVSIEALAMGLPIITGFTHENQVHYAKYIEDNGFGYSLDSWHNSLGGLKVCTNKLIGNFLKIQEKINSLQFPKSKENILNLFDELRKK